METKYKVAAIQMESKPNKQDNIERALELIDEASVEGVRIVGFHEYFLSEVPEKGETLNDIKERSEPIPGTTTEIFADKAREHGMFIVMGTIYELGKDRKIYNTSVFLGSKGEIIGKCRKSHLENPPIKHEDGCGIISGPGDYKVFDTELGKISIMIDSDANAVEVPRILGLKGADIIFHPMNWTFPYLHMYRSLAKVSSTVSGAYIVQPCRVGLRKSSRFGDILYGGGSGVVWRDYYVAQIPPFVTYVGKQTFKEAQLTFGQAPVGLAIATVDIKWKRKHRLGAVPRRPDTYGSILSN